MFRREPLEREFDEEIQDHLSRLEERYRKEGMSDEEARSAARRRFGGIEQLKQEHRDAVAVSLVDSLRRDLLYAIRLLRRSPAFACVAIVSLTMGIGANTALFSVFNAVALRSLPVSAPSELLEVRRQGPGVSNLRFSYPMFVEFRKVLANIADSAAMSRVSRMVIRPDGGLEPEFANVQLVSDAYFRTLGVSAALGRLLDENDNKNVGGHPVAMISDEFWHRRMAGATDVIGKRLSINGASFTIVGVAQRNFTGVWLEIPTDIWVPLVMQNDVRYAQNYSANQADTGKPWIPQNTIWWLDFIVRPQNAATASAVLDTTFKRLITPAGERIADPVQREQFLRQRIELRPFGQGLSGLRQRFVSPLRTLMAMVGLLLLVACANTANLLLARATSRQREIAVRLSLGASRARLIRQLLVEGLLVGSVASISGLALTPWLSNLLIRRTVGIANTPAPFSADLDLRVFAFTVVLSFATTLLFSLIPAFRTTRVSLAGSLKSASRAVHTGSRLNPAKLFVVCQVALSLVLIAGAALAIASLRNLLRADLGFDQEHVISVGLRIGATKENAPRIGDYRAEDLPALYRKLIEKIETLPGVRSSSLAECGLVSGCVANADDTNVAGYGKSPGERILVQLNRVGARYFSTVGMRMVQGREFDDRDLGSKRKVAIVNQAMANRYFSNRTAIGGLFGFPNPEIEIVGVVADARVNAVRQPANPMVYLPIESFSIPRDLEVRTGLDPAPVAGELRNALREVDSNLVIEGITIMSDRVKGTLNSEHLIASLTSIFGILALGLACFGLYGVISYAVSRRKPELGVRFALGAARSEVLWMILKESLVLVFSGIVLGLLLVFLLRGVLSAILFGIGASDPSTLFVAASILVVVGVLSAGIPAWRASRTDPMSALRYE